MTSLFRSLVERSVRAPPAVGGQASQSSEPAAAPSAEGEAARDASGAIVPRRRSRYEGGPAPEPALGETLVVTDAAALASEAQRGREEPAEVSAAPASVGPPIARVPARPFAASRPVSDETRHRAPVPSPPRPASLIAVPVEASLTSPAPAAESPPGRDVETPPPPAPTPPARARGPDVRNIASVAAVPPAPEQSPADHLAAPTPVPSSRTPTARGAAPPSIAAQPEPLGARAGEIAPARQRDPAREGGRASGSRHAPPPAEPPAAPRVQVSIGRVEVRAVYAPPPSPARARAAASTMSLDDYLKQRETGG